MAVHFEAGKRENLMEMEIFADFAVVICRVRYLGHVPEWASLLDKFSLSCVFFLPYRRG